jgi:hypothetical protein
LCLLHTGVSWMPASAGMTFVAIIRWRRNTSDAPVPAS